MTAFVLNRRGFLGGLIATVGAAAVAAPVLKPTEVVAWTRSRANDLRVANTGLAEATQGMVEDAIAEGRLNAEFNLRELMWTARFNVFQHAFDVLGTTREQALLNAMNQMLKHGIDYRVMPEQVCEHLNKSYGRLLHECINGRIDQVELSLSPAQMGLLGPRASLVPRMVGSHEPDIYAGGRVQRALDGDQGGSRHIDHSRNYIRSLAGQPTRSWKQGET